MIFRLPMRFNHIDGVNVKANFSKDLRFRYRLEITLKNSPLSGKTACVVMQNPSYAGENVADKSVKFMEKVVFQKNLPEFAGVRRLIVVNQFAAFRQKTFKVCRAKLVQKIMLQLICVGGI